MDLHLVRTECTDEGIFGELRDASGKRLCYTLEHSYDFKPKVPAGLYKCVRGMHALRPGHPFVTFEITGVEGHTGILIHPGNTEEDSKGCVLVGQQKEGRALLKSRLAFNCLMGLLEGLNTFDLFVS